MAAPVESRPRFLTGALPVGLLLALAAGTVLRLVPWAKFQGVGFDESLYVAYLGKLLEVGLWRYPDIVDGWLSLQRTLPGSILPPTRFLDILTALVWHGVFGTGPLASFHAVSRAFAVGNLLLGMVFAFRLGGARLKDVAGLSLTKLFVGSEGTLGIVTEVVLRLIPKQRPPATLVATFATLDDATAAVLAIRRQLRPSMLEFMDGPTIRAAT